MGIDASAVARGTGIDTQFQPTSGTSAAYLPQRIGVFAQGESGVSYTTTKTQFYSAKEVGAVAGYKSPAYAIARELWPVSGGGVGTIPVEFFLLAEASGATAAAGDATPTASAISKTHTAYFIIGGVRSLPFTVPKLSTVAATDISDILERGRQAVNNKLGMPGTMTHEYGAVTNTPGGGNTGDGAVTVTVSSGGAPKAGTWTATCTAEAVDAGTFTIVDPDGYTVGTITAGAAAADLGGLNWTIGDGTDDWDIGDTHAIEVPSSKLNFTSGWKGQSANDITIEVDAPTGLGITWAFTQPTGGATNPTVDAALAQIGDTWTTMIVNALDIEDTTALDAFQDWGGNPDDDTGRWASTVKKPAIVFTGNNEVSVNDATAVTVDRTSDNVNVQINVNGSPNLPCVIAARAVVEIAKLANNNPPHDYGRRKLSSLTAGLDSEQWTYTQRDAALKRGTSTTQIRDNVVTLSDVITMYAPSGESPPAYRYVVDIVRLQNAIFNFDLIFDSDEWEGKPLIPDGQPTVNPDARNESAAKAACFGILDRLAQAAIISDPATSKAATTATIDSSNPKRLNIVCPFFISGNTNIKDITLRFSFFLG